MFDKLLNFIVKASSVEPTYTPEHCLVVTKKVGGCTICRDTCPHDAITINKKVEIDDVDCTGCGLCVQACPSQALESKVSYQPGAPVKCSQVKGSAQTVQCLTRLHPSDLLRLASTRGKVTLARGDCADCHIGAPKVLAALDSLVEDAAALATFRGREIDFRITETATLDATDNPDPVSRRELLRGGFRGMQRGAADALKPLDPGGDDDKTLPKEMQRHFRLIERAQPQPETEVPWTLPRVHDGCIMCPVCTNVCPTDAFERTFDPPDEGGGATLHLHPERCMGCNACAASCPVKVITLDEHVTWGELSAETLPAYRKDPKEEPKGAVSRSPGRKP